MSDNYESRFNRSRGSTIWGSSQREGACFVGFFGSFSAVGFSLKALCMSAELTHSLARGPRLRIVSLYEGVFGVLSGVGFVGFPENFWIFFNISCDGSRIKNNYFL